jgi:predicted dehydrogenase
LGAIGSHALDGLLWLLANVTQNGENLADAFNIRGATLGQVHPTRRDHDGVEKQVTADDIASATFSIGSAVGTMLIHGAASDEAIDLLTIRGTEGTLVLDHSLKLYWGKGRSALKEYVTMLPGSVPNRFRANPFAAGTVLLAEALVDAFDDHNPNQAITQHPRLQHAATLHDGARVQRYLDRIRVLAQT